MKKRLLFLVNEDSFFISHRLNLAIKALEENFDVAVATKITDKAEVIIKNNIKLFDLKFMNRSSISISSNIMSVREIHSICKLWSPDIIHQISLKPIILGSLATFFNRKILSINTITGFGHVFSSKSFKYKIISFILCFLFLIIFFKKRTKIIVQNKDDLIFLKKFIFNKNNLLLIKGSGVNLKLFKKLPFYFGKPRVVYIGRMIYSKGIEDFVKIARIVNKKLPFSVEFTLVGGVDLDNPLSISEKQLLIWQKEGSVKWLGKVNNIINVLKSSTLVCFPSTYGEGVPKALIEAAACGKPIVAYNIPGCKEIVSNNENGFLIDKGNVDDMSKAIIKIICNKYVQNKMSSNGRKIVIKDFSENIVFDKTFKIYTEYDK